MAHRSAVTGKSRRAKKKRLDIMAGIEEEALAVAVATEAEESRLVRKKRQSRKGRRQAILTTGRGVLGDAPLSRPSARESILLGG